MKICTVITSALLFAIAPMAPAADANAKARLMHANGSHDDVIILLYKNETFRYKMNERDLNRVDVRMNKLDGVYFYTPPIFKEAMELYQARKYAEAKVKFQACAKAFRAIDTAPGNFATLAGFYSLECSRRQFKLDELNNEQGQFMSKALVRENQIQQLEVNAFWEAVRLKSWERLDRLAQAWSKRKVSGSQRAQISYCHGLALEQLAKKDPKRMSEALNTYNRVLSADFTASMELVIEAANNTLRIYATDPEVKLAMDLWQTEDENKSKGGYQRLLEANALVKLYEQAGFDAMKPLTPEYKKFLQYESKPAGS